MAYAGDLKIVNHQNGPPRVVRSEDTRNLKTGDVIEVWDRTLVWDENCVTADMADRSAHHPPPGVDVHLT
jgi:hypothetical protein